MNNLQLVRINEKEIHVYGELTNMFGRKMTRYVGKIVKEEWGGKTKWFFYKSLWVIGISKEKIQELNSEMEKLR